MLYFYRTIGFEWGHINLSGFLIPQTTSSYSKCVYVLMYACIFVANKWIWFVRLQWVNSQWTVSYSCLTSMQCPCSVTVTYMYFDIKLEMPDVSQTLNTLRPKQNGRHFPDDIFKCIFVNGNIWISIKISLKIVPEVLINNIPALVHIMAWRRPGDKPLSEPMLVSLLTHICLTRPQWVNQFLHSL